MKMEVLSVQNQFQGRQFGVIGSTKAKDWTSPLTPPPPPPTTTKTTTTQQQHNRNNSHQQRSNSSAAINNHQNNSNNTQSDDVVDGRQSSTSNHKQHNNHQQQQHLFHHAHQFNQAAMEAAATAAVEPASARYAAYNNNLLCCEPISATQTIAPVSTSSGARFGAPLDDIDATAVNELSQRLQAELRAAKSRHLGCTEVSLPWDLTTRIAVEIIKTSEREPCGVRGCTIFIEFEDEPNNTRRIASFKLDANNVSTFELYLTLKHDKSGWTSLLPQFLKNLTRSSTILISPDFTLTKNKLYSCE